MEPPLRLSQVSYDADGALNYPHHQDRAPESDLAGYLAHAHEYLESLPDDVGPPATPADGVSADFTSLQWFDLPAACLAESATS